MDAKQGTLEALNLTIGGQPITGLHAGSGDPLLLVHGGWGGASMHWSAVVDRLATRYRVIAPDLPGIGRTDQPPLTSVAAYAHWLRDVLAELDIDSAYCAGNSFGASVVARFATDFPLACRGLVLVDGFPVPHTPRVLHWLGQMAWGRRVLAKIVKRVSYSPYVLPRAFFDLAHVPDELKVLVRQPNPPQIPAFARVLVEGDEPVSHAMKPLLLWGADDRLPGTHPSNARRLQASWPGASLVFVPHAGHMPQVENPTAFVDALVSFLDAGPTSVSVS